MKIDSVMGTQKIQSLLNMVVLIVSLSDKDLGDGNFETLFLAPPEVPLYICMRYIPSV